MRCEKCLASIARRRFYKTAITTLSYSKKKTENIGFLTLVGS
jgi:hypothetical protein